jgi:hypothetical protein
MSLPRPGLEVANVMLGTGAKDTLRATARGERVLDGPGYGHVEASSAIAAPTRRKA